MTTTARLGAIESWIFDLDNTLYLESSQLFDQIRQRMTAFIADHFSLDPQAASAKRRELYLQYGTTLRGLMVEERIEPQIFLDYVHNIDLSSLLPAERLGRAIEKLPGIKLVHTNASVAHARRVLARLGLETHFPAIFDIAAADWIPKPDPSGYRTLWRAHGIDPTRACMIEDIAVNLKPASEAGMVTVLVGGPQDGSADYSYVDYRTDDLAAWLEGVVA